MTNLKTVVVAFATIFWSGRLAAQSIIGKCPKEPINQMAIYLATTDKYYRHLASNALLKGGFAIIPPSEVSSTINRLKKDSYKHCYDDSCQIELGRELAAHYLGSIDSEKWLRIVDLKSKTEVCAINLRVSTANDASSASSDSENTIKQVRIGMTGREVLGILGSPTSHSSAASCGNSYLEYCGHFLYYTEPDFKINKYGLPCVLEFKCKNPRSELNVCPLVACSYCKKGVCLYN